MAVPTKTQTQEGLMWHFICSGLERRRNKVMPCKTPFTTSVGVSDSSAIFTVHIMYLQMYYASVKVFFNQHFLKH